MNTVNEADHLLTQSNDQIFEQPRSFQWRIFQAMLYLIGSLSFTAGSCMYFTKVFRAYANALVIGGWSFTIGSLVFLFADLQDWWDYRTGYCFSYKEHQIEDISLDSFNSPSSLSPEENNPSNIELNVYGSMCGILFYLAGSIFFIPIFGDYLAIGEWFFIFGSTFCYSSLIWKMYRSACQNCEGKFRLKTLLKDMPLLAMDLLSTIGNICFFFGTILFLSYINHSDSDENRAAFSFVFGSGCFVLSSLILQYTIVVDREDFYSSVYVHTNK